MAEKEERILIARSTDYTISDTKDGALFEGKIAPHCANVFSRQEAISKMAKEICNHRVGECPEKEYHCNDCWADSNTLLAEAALNALLEGK